MPEGRPRIMFGHVGGFFIGIEYQVRIAAMGVAKFGREAAAA